MANVSTSNWSAVDRIKKARTELILRYPFFGYILLKQQIVPDEKLEILPMPTMGTTGKILYYYPEFVDKLSDTELCGVLVHEAMHIVMCHSLRMQDRHAAKWNLAGDLAINPLIKEAGLDLPKDAALDDKFAEMDAETIYARLPEVQTIEVAMSGGKCMDGEGKEGKNKSGGDGEGGDKKCKHKICGGILEPKGKDGRKLTESERSREMAEGKVMLSQAYNYAKAIGSIPGGLERFIGDLLKPKIDWREKLRYFLEVITKNDYSWMRGNRKYMPQGIYLPSLHSFDIGEIVVAIDTSGSISQTEMQVFLTELSAILDVFDFANITVIYCDAEVANVQEFTKADLPITAAAQPRGGGGTDFRPPFEYVKENGLDPKVFIYMTDMYGPFPEEPLECPTLWLSTSGGEDRFEVPFGEVIDISDIKEN